MDNMRVYAYLVIASDDSYATELTFLYAEIFVWTTDKHGIDGYFYRTAQPFYCCCIEIAIDNE